MEILFFVFCWIIFLALSATFNKAKVMYWVGLTGLFFQVLIVTFMFRVVADIIRDPSAIKGLGFGQVLALGLGTIPFLLPVFLAWLASAVIGSPLMAVPAFIFFSIIQIVIHGAISEQDALINRVLVAAKYAIPVLSLFVSVIRVFLGDSQLSQPPLPATNPHIVANEPTRIGPQISVPDTPPKDSKERESVAPRLMKSFERHSRGVLSVFFSPDLSRVGSVGLDRIVRIWDCKSGKELGTLEWMHPKEQASDVLFSPDGYRVWLTNHNHATGKLTFVDIESGKDALTFNNSKEIEKVAFASDGRRAYVFCRDRYLEEWDILVNKVIRSYPIDIDGREIPKPKPFQFVKLFPDQGFVLFDVVDESNLIDPYTRNPSRALYQFDVTQRELTKIHGAYHEYIAWVAVSPDGRRVTYLQPSNPTWTSGGSLERLIGYVWIVQLTQTRNRVSCVQLGSESKFSFLKSEFTHSISPPISADGRYFVSLHPYSKTTLRLWDATTGQVMHEFVAMHQDEITCICFSHDGRYLASGGVDGIVKLWRLPK